MFWSAGCSFLRAEVFSCSLNVNWNSIFKKKIKFFFSCYFFLLQFLVIKTRDPVLDPVGIRPKMLDPDPESINPDPKHWLWIIIRPRPGSIGSEEPKLKTGSTKAAKKRKFWIEALEWISSIKKQHYTQIRGVSIFQFLSNRNSSPKSKRNKVPNTKEPTQPKQGGNLQKKL